MINAIATALSGLTAATKKVAATASNIANLQTVGSLETGGRAPYTPLTTQQSAEANGGVRAEYAPKSDPFYPAYIPDSSFANGQGLVGVPNVDLAEEAVNLQIAKTAYKANIATIKAAEDMEKELLGIFDEKV